MISPTGKGIRSDAEGDGGYGSARGSRRHNGVDYLCDVGQPIKAPFNMVIVRHSHPYTDPEMDGVAWKSGNSTGRMWYFIPFESVIGEKVNEGEIIGHAQSVSEYHGLPLMGDHIHFKVST